MSSTQASSVYDRLQQDILSGRLKPGERLRLKELIEVYETGNSPLREALNRLSSNGLVVREENRGFSVPHTSLTELEEHSRLHDAVLARDTEKALEILHQHYKVTLEILSESGRFE